MRGKKIHPLKQSTRVANPLPENLPRTGAVYWNRWFEILPSAAIRKGMLNTCKDISLYPTAKQLLEKGNLREILTFTELLYDSTSRQALNASSRALTRNKAGKMHAAEVILLQFRTYGLTSKHLLDVFVADPESTRHQEINQEIENLLQKCDNQEQWLACLQDAQNIRKELSLAASVNPLTQLSSGPKESFALLEKMIRVSLAETLYQYPEAFLSWPQENLPQLEKELKAVSNVTWQGV